jgi:hypothetical protein
MEMSESFTVVGNAYEKLRINLEKRLESGPYEGKKERLGNGALSAR